MLHGVDGTIVVEVSTPIKRGSKWRGGKGSVFLSISSVLKTQIWYWGWSTVVGNKGVYRWDKYNN